MEGNSERLYEGLALIYRGKWIGLIGLVCTFLLAWVPPLSFLCLLATMLGAAIVVVGQVKLLREHRDYEKALILLVIGIFLDLMRQYVPGVPGLCAGWLGTVCSLLELYFLIHATDYFLRQRSREDLASLGRTTMIVAVVCNAAALVLQEVWKLFAVSLGLLIAGAAVFSAIAIVGEGVLLCYLKRSRDAF